MAETGEVRVHCPRIDHLCAVWEHLACPYCFGRARDVETGDPHRFCDFDPALDPVVFGFPESSTRLRDG